ncbi:MAG: HAMP domain-containing histidine kinase [Deltaproteobacteria bacterium]|nr:HAMP domain-containing histidine kinase [Deltaproteobacteria bacterium]MBW2532978.1 HAMP domain-containing histidine kinase [Deltaproteobacteria bacterium]
MSDAKRNGGTSTRAATPRRKLAPGSDDRGKIPAPPPSASSLRLSELPLSDDSTEAPSLKTVLSSEGYDQTDEKFEEAADKALKERPYFSFRARLVLALAVVFVMALGVSVWSVHIMSELGSKIDFLEVADKYAAEIQQARRFEKNYLLYGEGLDDALNHTHHAQSFVRANTGRFEKVVGKQVLEIMQEDIVEYERLLNDIRSVRLTSARKRMEGELRDHGAEMVSSSQVLTEKERSLVQNRLSTARLIPFVWLGALLLVLVLIANFVARTVLNRLHRYLDITDRIAAGDLTPITPGRRFRDEFTDLALHINNMVRQLNRQYRILVESHKLRAMGTLVAGVAHELNNPLNNIMLTSEVLVEEYDFHDDGERKDMMRELIQETERARTIVHNLLDFARESDTKLQALRLSSVVDETLALVANQAKVKKIRLKCTVPEDLPEIHGDRQLLRQVFMNLILNAVDALPEKGKIDIALADDQREGFVSVDITDNGPGIPDHVLSRIFDPFFTTKPQGKGTGLGLSVSRGIVRKLGGYLLVASRLGRGTTFTVVLPRTGAVGNGAPGMSSPVAEVE